MEKKETFEDLRQLTLDHVWVPVRPWNDLNSPGGFNIFTQAEGCRMTDVQGKTYLDYFSALGNVSSLGYGRKEIADAVYEQTMRLHVQPTHETTIPQINLSKKLSDLTSGRLSRVFLGNSGTEGVEAAMKMVRKYQLISGFPKRYKIIVGGFRYHGCTYGAMSLGGRGPSFTWEEYEPLLPGVVRVASPYCFRCDLDLKYPSCNIKCAREIERAIQLEGPDTVAAFLDVTIATEYSTPPPREYWPMVRSICDKYNILLVLDEVMSGLGRTGKWFGFEHWDIVPDITVIAKSLTNGAVPLGATIVKKEVAQKFDGGFKEMLRHSYTYSGHPVACAAAVKTLEIMERENVVDNARTMGKYLFDTLKSSLRKHRMVGEIRGGLGLDCHVEFVKDRESGEKFSGEENRAFTAKLKNAIRKNGLWGPVSNPIILRPALVITKEEIDEIVSGLDKALREIEG